jgi:hypothetical protein
MIPLPFARLCSPGGAVAARTLVAPLHAPGLRASSFEALSLTLPPLRLDMALLEYFAPSLTLFHHLRPFHALSSSLGFPAGLCSSAKQLWPRFCPSTRFSQRSIHTSASSRSLLNSARRSDAPVRSTASTAHLPRPASPIRTSLLQRYQSY